MLREGLRTHRLKSQTGISMADASLLLRTIEKSGLLVSFPGDANTTVYLISFYSHPSTAQIFYASIWVMYMFEWSNFDFHAINT